MTRILPFPRIGTGLKAATGDTNAAMPPASEAIETASRPKRGDASRRVQRARRLIRMAYGIDPGEPGVVRYELIGRDTAVVRLVTEVAGAWAMSIKVARAVGKAAEPLPEDSKEGCGGREGIAHLESLYAKYGAARMG